MRSDGITPAVAIELDTTLPPLKPDLSATSVSLSAPQATEGDAATFSTTISNAGPGDANDAAVRFLVDGAQIGSDRTAASLAAGGSATVSSDAWTATTGTHIVQVVVDPANAIDEIDEGNNSASATFAVQTKAGLTPATLSLSVTKGKSGDAVTVSAKVANLGEASASTVVVRFLLDGVQLGAERTIAKLAGGASVVVSSDVWSAARQDGQHTVQVLDPANSVTESNEANNTAALTFRVKGGRVSS